MTNDFAEDMNGFIQQPNAKSEDSEPLSAT